LATKEAHLAKAQDNESFAESIQNRSRAEREWGIIIRFYAAVHYVEAYLSATEEGTSSHVDRRKVIHRRSELAEIEAPYQQLYDLAWNSRYLTLPCTSQDVFTAHELLLEVKTVLNPLLL
jgi:hypothetical protein